MQTLENYSATTYSGLETLLAEELKALGAQDIEIAHRAVTFKGDKALMYRTNYCVRTAIRILKPIVDFPVNNENDYYRAISRINWSQYLSIDKTFAIDATLSNSKMTHSQYAALKAKDAIVDQFYRKQGKRPDVETRFPDLRINIYMHNNHCTVSLDSSGGSLHKRGYRRETGEAPLNEVLAAGMIMLSGWDKKSHFIDPMCGSGTLLIEAAMTANNIPAGYFRKFYGFIKWDDFDQSLWQQIKEEALQLEEEFEYSIIGNDIDTEVLHKAMRNIQNAKLQYDITLQEGDMADLRPPKGKGIIIVNPPYGERLKTRDNIELYKKMGDTFKKHFSGYEAWVISSDLVALKNLGLHPTKKLSLNNGALECKYERFELYQGSKKAKYQPKKTFEKKGTEKTTHKAYKSNHKSDKPFKRDNFHKKRDNKGPADSKPKTFKGGRSSGQN